MVAPQSVPMKTCRLSLMARSVAADTRRCTRGSSLTSGRYRPAQSSSAGWAGPLTFVGELVRFEQSGRPDASHRDARGPGGLPYRFGVGGAILAEAPAAVVGHPAPQARDTADLQAVAERFTLLRQLSGGDGRVIEVFDEQVGHASSCCWVRGSSLTVRP